MTLRLDASSDGDLVHAARILLDGGLVAVPTETVYGLAADASNDSAVDRVFSVKGRPKNHPLIVHVAGRDEACRLAATWTHAAEILSTRFWPGPLSVLVDKSAIVSDHVTGNRTTVVVRVPDNDATLHVLRSMHSAGSIGLAAPSANKFGEVSPTAAEHVLADLNGLVDAVLDGGPCDIGVESTIVDCRTSEAVVLREGGVPFDALREELALHGMELKRPGEATRTDEAGHAIAPGMLASHYAPRALVELFEDVAELDKRRIELASRGLRVHVLPHPENSYEYSRGLYASMRECDATGVDVILALLPDAAGLGAAIRDRLVKAAAPR